MVSEHAAISAAFSASTMHSLIHKTEQPAHLAIDEVSMVSPKLLLRLLEAKGEAARVASVAEELQRQLRTTAKPASYLAEQLELAEGRRLEADGQVGALTQQLREHADALAASRAQNEQLLHDLEALLSQRGSLDALRATLTRLLPPELGPALAPQSAAPIASGA